MKCFNQSILAAFLIIVACVLVFPDTMAQCSVCTKTAEQLGEKPGKGLNSGILYLMLTPLIALFYIGYRWYKRERMLSKSQNQA